MKKILIYLVMPVFILLFAQCKKSEDPASAKKPALWFLNSSTLQTMPHWLLIHYTM